MGCGGSYLACQEEKDEMCLEACRKIMLDIVPKTLAENHSGFVICAPTKELESVRKLVTDLRQVARERKQKMNEKGQGAIDSVKNVSSMATSSGPAAIGSMMDKAVDVAGKAIIGGAASLAGAGIGKTLHMLADSIESQLASLDAKFSEAGQELLATKREQVTQCYYEAISVCNFQQPENLMKGMANDAASKAFHTECIDQLSASLHPHTQAVTQSKGLIGAWDGIVQKANEANKLLGQFEIASKSKQNPIKLDVNRYIAEQTCMQLVPTMAKKEAALRKFPNQFLISVCLSKEGITAHEYQKFKTSQS